MPHFSLSDLLSYPKDYRTHLVNSLNGYKSANLIGTRDGRGHTNLAVFSSVIHLGSNPPLLGMVTRPSVVPRHTYENIQETGFYTINHIHAGIVRQAHQTSARYARERSEFAATGLTEEYLRDFPAPFVQESTVKMGMALCEALPVETNGTILLVGEIQHLHLPENVVDGEGRLDLPAAGSLAISGLDTYLDAGMLHRFSYAKTDRELEDLRR